MQYQSKVFMLLPLTLTFIVRTRYINFNHRIGTQRRAMRSSVTAVASTRRRIVTSLLLRLLEVTSRSVCWEISNDYLKPVIHKLCSGNCRVSLKESKIHG
jgi:hypothetical protein